MLANIYLPLFSKTHFPVNSTPHHRLWLPMSKRHRLSTIAILILSTLLWGTAVAGHQHFDTKPELCETCLLPQMADVGRVSIAVARATPIASRYSASVCNPLLQIITAYFGRGPPA